MAITPLGGTPASAVSQAAPRPAGADGGGFGDALRQLLTSVDDTTNTANTAVANMVGGTGEVHEAMIALHRAEMTLHLTIQIRNKLVAAYQDVMRMPI